MNVETQLFSDIFVIGRRKERKNQKIYFIRRFKKILCSRQKSKYLVDRKF